MIKIITNSEQERDKIFLTYKKILYRFKLLNVTTKNGKEISYLDLRKAIITMVEKHPSCRWRQNSKSKKYFILIEGYYWLTLVYFQKEKFMIDADIEFFETRIKQYEELLKVQEDKKWWNESMSIKGLEKYFNRKESSIRKAISKMCKAGMGNYKSYVDGKLIISQEGVEWLCKNVFKRKYLELLEKYKMELTEIYIDRGYPYDQFFKKICNG